MVYVYVMGLGTHSCLIPLQNTEKRNKKTRKRSKKLQDRYNGEDIHGDTTFDVCDLDFVGIIGKGTYGKVYLAHHPGHKIYYAVKVIPKKYIDPKRHHQILTERNILTKIGLHPFIITLHYAVQTVDHLCLVMDYIYGGELYYHMRKNGHFTERQARFLAAEIAVALGYLHQNDIIYRDLKPENVLLSMEGHIILIDFGLCREYAKSNTIVSTVCGTPEYLAPEIIRKESYTRAVDWWGLGIILYELLYGHHPFHSWNISVMYNNILNQDLKLKESISISARNILEQLLQRNPVDRLGFGEGDVEEIKMHDFFLPLLWEDVERKQSLPPYHPTMAYSDYRQKSLKRQSFSLISDTNFLGDEVRGSLYEGFSPLLVK